MECPKCHAAPELLEALKELVKDSSPYLTDAEIADAKNAIEKAEGGQE